MFIEYRTLTKRIPAENTAIALGALKSVKHPVEVFYREALMLVRVV
jgi:hypothetical protein